MKKKDNKVFLYIIIIIMLAMFVVGITYAFIIMTKTDNTTINGSYAKVGIDLDVEKVVGNNKLIPLDDENLATAISSEHECITTLGYNACHIYKITVTNTGDTIVPVTSNIKFNLTDITNLKWREIASVNTIGVIDNSQVENGNSPVIASSDNTTWRASDTIGKNSSNEYYIVVWISNLNEAQNDQDKGMYEGTITFETTSGEVTSTFRP